MDFNEWWKIYKKDTWSTAFSHGDVVEIARDAWDASQEQPLDGFDYDEHPSMVCAASHKGTAANASAQAPIDMAHRHPKKDCHNQKCPNYLESCFFNCRLRSPDWCKILEEWENAPRPSGRLTTAKRQEKPAQIKPTWECECGHNNYVTRSFCRKCGKNRPA